MPPLWPQFHTLTGRCCRKEETERWICSCEAIAVGVLLWTQEQLLLTKVRFSFFSRERGLPVGLEPGPAGRGAGPVAKVERELFTTLGR